MILKNRTVLFILLYSESEGGVSIIIGVCPLFLLFLVKILGISGMYDSERIPKRIFVFRQDNEVDVVIHETVREDDEVVFSAIVGY